MCSKSHVRAQDRYAALFYLALQPKTDDQLVEDIVSLCKRVKSDKRVSLNPEQVSIFNIGSSFCFMNREVECEQLFNAILSLENIRRSGAPKDAIKKEVWLPVCNGIASIGKTTFARKALTAYAKNAKRCSDPVKNELLNIFKSNDNYMNLRVGKYLAIKVQIMTVAHF